MPANRRVLLILTAAVLLAALAGLLGWRLSARPDTAAPATIGVQSLAGHQFCGGSIRIYTDADMLRIAHTLAVDSRSVGVFTRTKQESYVQFQRDFAGQPGLLTLARPAALPAEIDVLPATHVDLAQFADQLRSQFSAAKTVGWAPRAPTCPASGEWPSPTPTK
jgi:hypothetical protein